MARKTSQTYPLTPEWKSRVRAEIEKRGPGAQSLLAKEIGCAQSTISELLRDESRYSGLVPRIHKAFGWHAPTPPLATATDEATQLGAIYNALDEEARHVLLEMAKALAKRSR